MTAIALSPSLAHYIKNMLEQSRANRPTIIDLLTKPSERKKTPLPIQIKTLWQLINTALATGDLDLPTLTDRPSQLKNGDLYLSYERVQGLLEDLFAERELNIIHITPTEFYAIMLQLGGKRYAIVSEWSRGTEGQGEARISYCLPIARFININQPAVKAQLAEVA